MKTFGRNTDGIQEKKFHAREDRVKAVGEMDAAEMMRSYDAIKQLTTWALLGSLFREKVEKK